MRGNIAESRMLRAFLVFFVWVVGFSGWCGAFPGDEGDTSPSQIYRSLLRLKPDSRKVARVKHFRLVREDARFELIEGYLALGRPIDGLVQAAFFWGKGRFVFSPYDSLEKAQLQRLFGNDTVRIPFRQLYLFFDDTTAREISSRLPLRHGRIATTLTADLKYVFKYLESSQKGHVPVEFVRSLLDSVPDGLFYAQFSNDIFEPYFFEIHPFAEESIRFYRRDLSTTVRYLKEVVCQYPPRPGHRARSLRDLDVVKYQIRTTIDRGLHVTSHIRLWARSLNPGWRWTYFWLDPTLMVKAVRDASGRPWPFWKGQNSALLWVQSPNTGATPQTVSLELALESNRLLERRGDWILLRASGMWYPRHDFMDRAIFDMEFRVPEGMELVAVGQRVDSTEVDGWRILRWRTERPIRAASFNMGDFRRRVLRLPGLPVVEVLLSPGAHWKAARSLLRFRVLSGRHMDAQVGRDVLQSLRFFSARFGPLPVSRLVVSEIPTFSGEAFPGFIQLSWETFQFSEKSGLDAVFRAHEVAHQWWGIAVAHRSYHDQWLSEGLAEYSALLYLEQLLGQTRFLKILARWRHQILGARRSFLGHGIPPGPLWLGIRNESYQTRGDFYLVVHKKAAWVFHMLRMLWLDPASGSDSLFTRLLRRYYRQFRGRQVSTATFQALVESVGGRPMDWFFRQWVYDYRLPEFRWSYRIRAGRKGLYEIQLRFAEQTGLKPLRLPVLVRVELENGQTLRRRLWLHEGTQELQIAGLPGRPVKMVLNDLESVLARFKQENW